MYPMTMCLSWMVWRGVKVAVKRIPLEKAGSNEQEEKALEMLDHTNVIKLFHVEEDQDFKYLKNENSFQSRILNLFENLL
jgi:hypothetical protein